jgi:hypothetical protein
LIVATGTSACLSEENVMNAEDASPPIEAKPLGLLARWLGSRRQPSPAQDSSELDVGYESALPWLNSAAGEESVGEDTPG